MVLQASRGCKSPNDFMSLAYEWLQAKSHRIKESTLSKYEHLTDTHIKEYFEGMPLTDINTALVNKKMMEMYEEKQSDLSYSTFRSIFYLIRAITTYGVTMGYYQQVYFNFEIADRTPQKDVQILNPTQEQEIIRIALTAQCSNHLGILLSLCTGLRLGEVCALSASDIDFGSRTIIVQKTVQRLSDQETNQTRLVVTEPKSRRSNRAIPLPTFLYEILVSYHVNEYGKKNYILTNSDCPYEPRTLQYAFQRITEKCGFDDLHFHCLRHTFATKCIRSGFDVKMVSEILGHASVSFTMNRYVHPSMEAKKEKMSILDQIWEAMKV